MKMRFSTMTHIGLIKVLIISLFIPHGGCFIEEDYPKDRIIQVLEDDLPAENFTYYRLQRDGFIRLELTSLMGDVDMYISSTTQYPSFDDYEMKSASCGVDTIIVPESIKRPVFVALYGHPNYLHSKFKLTTYLSQQPKYETYEDLVSKLENYEAFRDGKSKEKEEKKSKSKSKQTQVRVEEQPLWAKILLGILEFGIDVII